jgi:hypothetical protein
MVESLFFGVGLACDPDPASGSDDDRPNGLAFQAALEILPLVPCRPETNNFGPCRSRDHLESVLWVSSCFVAVRAAFSAAIPLTALFSQVV